MTFLSQKAVKGQVLADFLVAHLVSKLLKLHMDISDEVIEANMTSEDEVWQMFFDAHQEQAPQARSLLKWG